MIKIKCGMFEFLVVACFYFELIMFFEIPFMILTIKYDVIHYLFLSLIVCLGLVLFLFVIFIICMIYNRRKRKTIIIDNEINIFKIYNEEFKISDINTVKYYKCKWYFIPIGLVYKHPVAGLMVIVTNDAKEFSEHIFYKDYIKLKNAGIKIEIL